MASAAGQPDFTAIIVAAGKGRRMGSAAPKQVLPLDGRPLLEHSIQAFERRPEVERIVLVVSPEQRGMPALDLAAFSKLARPVDGGSTRQESVRRGLEAVIDTEWVLVHDAARPFVGDSLISAVIQAARVSGAAIPARRIGDTVKSVEGDRIVATLPRDGMILAQTPQAFRLDLLRRAHAAAGRDGFQGTDDAHLVERLGEPVTWVEGSPLNLKVTQPGDLELAEALVRAGALEAGH